MAGIGSHPYLVHYVLPEGPSRGQCRPAVVVNDWTGVAYHDQPETCNLIAFIDGSNDGLGDDYVLWPTSVHHTTDGADATWHTHGECAAATAARAESDAANPPPAEASSDASTPPPVDSAPSDGSADPTAPQSVSGPSDSSIASAGSGSPETSLGDSAGDLPAAPDPIHSDPDLFAQTHGMSQDEFHPVVPTGLLTNQPAQAPEGGEGQ